MSLKNQRTLLISASIIIGLTVVALVGLDYTVEKMSESAPQIADANGGPPPDNPFDDSLGPNGTGKNGSDDAANPMARPNLDPSGAARLDRGDMPQQQPPNGAFRRVNGGRDAPNIKRSPPPPAAEAPPPKPPPQQVQPSRGGPPPGYPPMPTPQQQEEMKKQYEQMREMYGDPPPGYGFPPPGYGPPPGYDARDDYEDYYDSPDYYYDEMEEEGKLETHPQGVEEKMADIEADVFNDVIDEAHFDEDEFIHDGQE